MKLQAGFIFLAEGADSEKNRTIIRTPNVDLTVTGVANYQEAARIAKKMTDKGVKAIELCGGFGILGVAKIKESVPAEVAVGVVRFDHHPGIGDRSGDELF